MSFWKVPHNYLCSHFKKLFLGRAAALPFFMTGIFLYIITVGPPVPRNAAITLKRLTAQDGVHAEGGTWLNPSRADFVMTYTNFFDYTCKCLMTVRTHIDDATVFNNTEDSRIALLKDIMDANPHYRHKWESGLEIQYVFYANDALKRIWWDFSYDEAEMRIIKELESKYMFDLCRVPYCAHWEMDQDEYRKASEEMEACIRRELGYKD